MRWSSTASPSAASSIRPSKRFVVDDGDIGNADIGVAMSGNAEFSGGDLRLAAGFAATRMSVDALEAAVAGLCLAQGARLVLDHLTSGTVERMSSR